MAIRLVVGLTIAPAHVWFGATVPTLFHLVLAAFVLACGPAPGMPIDNTASTAGSGRLNSSSSGCNTRMSAYLILRDTGGHRGMQIRSLTMAPLEIPFRQAFTHAAATRATTETVLVRAESARGLVGMGEGCPRRYVTGETVAGALGFFCRYRAEWLRLITVDDLRAWVAGHADEIDPNAAAWCAVELACLDLLGKEALQPIEVVLGGSPPSGSFQYSGVLGAAELSSFEKQLHQYLAVGVTDFKLKVRGDFAADFQRVAAFKAEAKPGFRLRLDANNRWQQAVEAAQYFQQLESPFHALEEPLQAGDYEGCRVLSKQCGLPIILDESFLRADQFRFIQDDPSRWVVNIRISKMGGLVRALMVADNAWRLGIPLVVGAQVGETSILTRAALVVVNRYRAIVMAQEEAFGTHLLEYDLCDPPLMFGQAGRLTDSSFYVRAGLGLSFTR